MAEETPELEEGEEGGEGKKAGGKLKMIIMIVVGALLLMALSIGGTWFMLKDKISSNEVTDISDMPLDDMVMDEEAGPAIYHAMQPSFVINYNSSGRTRFLQADLSLVTRDPAVIEVVILHNPLIRNNLLDVFSLQNIETLATAEGKQALVDDLTLAIQEILEVEMGQPGIETVLFRSFIMQ